MLPIRGGPAAAAIQAGAPHNVGSYIAPPSAPSTSSTTTFTFIRWHGGPAVAADAPTVTVNFLQPDGTTKSVAARVGESLLQTAHRYDIDLEGACEGGTTRAELKLKLNRLPFRD